MTALPVIPRTPGRSVRHSFTFFFALLALSLPASLVAQALTPPDHPTDNRVWGANFAAAGRFAPYKARTLTYSTSVVPQWIEGTDQFWYEWRDSNGTFYYLVDPARASKRPIFDNAKMAADLTSITHDPYDAKHLPIKGLDFKDSHTVTFEVQSSQDEPDTARAEGGGRAGGRGGVGRGGGQGGGRSGARKKKTFHFEYDVNTGVLEEITDWEAPITYPGWASVSPDSSMVVYAYQCNLYSIGWADFQKILEARRGKTGEAADSAEDGVQVSATQLTEDGEKNWCYGSAGRGDTDDESAKQWDKKQGSGILWSHDSRWFAMIRRDQRKVGELWLVHNVGSPHPQLESWKYEFPGDTSVTQSTLLVYDTQAHQMKHIDDSPSWKDEQMGLFSAFEGARGGRGRGGGGDSGSSELRIRKWLSPKSNELYWYRMSRDEHRVDVMVADPATGATHALIQERLNTYVELAANAYGGLRTNPWRLDNGDLIWRSERDGWAHLYRYGADGTLKNRLTQGPWHVADMVGVDEAKGVVYFTANNREKGEDPYYTHLYRVNVDGTGLRLLDSGDFDHRPSIGESDHYFVDNYSRVNTVPATALYDAAGRKVMDLEKADFSALMAAGYKFPEPFTVKSADGVTDLYGVMYKPFDFDPSKKYPIVASVYPGPQTESVATSWSMAPTQTAMAQMGMIVITIGNRGGSPARSKWYHNYGYGNNTFRDYGLADKKAGIEELADRYAYIDLDRVGIYGHSGGGFMSTAAMLVYPDFFKVAVSGSGNHDNNVYGRYWSEKNSGVKETVGRNGDTTFVYDIEKNSDLASNLKGHLLLTVGLIDNNVPPANTYRVANALIKANKRFDFFVYPGQRHGYGDMSNYHFWLRAEYFAKWLLHDERTAVDIEELNNEVQQTHPRGG